MVCSTRLTLISRVLSRDNAVTELMRKPEPEAIHGRNSKGQDIGILPTALVYNTMLPNLFRFSYFCEEEDGKCYCGL